MVVHAATIFLSAFLLFLVQPILAKQILPWFGGAAIVWTSCMVFFQLVLLLGYAYSHWITTQVRSPRQNWIHIGLLVASVAFLPIVPSDHRAPGMGIEFERLGPADRRALHAFFHQHDLPTRRPENGTFSV